MNRQVGAAIDASAMLALLFDEPGAQAVADVIADGASISTVNLTEVATVLHRRGLETESVLAPVRVQVSVEPFDESDALYAAAIYSRTTHAGLSLGDRACFALASRLGVPAVTAEQAWAELDVDVDVHVIRERRS